MFTPEGVRIPVTRISTGPCYICGLDTATDAPRVQLGFADKKQISKALAGHLKKAGIEKKLRFFRSVGTEGTDGLSLGKEIRATDVFKPGDNISVSGRSKGKGFAGVVKRHHFAGGPRTHGQSDRERSPGSLGQTTTPGRVYRGKRMAGRMGNDNVTVSGLKVIAIDAEHNIITVKGVVPGAKKGLLILSKEA